MVNYEKNIKQIEEIIEKLENEEISLEENIQLVEKATLLTKECKEYLDKAELKIINILDEKNSP